MEAAGHRDREVHALFNREHDPTLPILLTVERNSQAGVDHRRFSIDAVEARAYRARSPRGSQHTPRADQRKGTI